MAGLEPGGDDIKRLRPEPERVREEMLDQHRRMRVHLNNQEEAFAQAATRAGYIQAQATWRTKSISPHREKKMGVAGRVRMAREHIRAAFPSQLGIPWGIDRYPTLGRHAGPAAPDRRRDFEDKRAAREHDTMSTRCGQK
jgi:hypothetical protein